MKIPSRKKWQPAPVFLPEKFLGGLELGTHRKKYSNVSTKNEGLQISWEDSFEGNFINLETMTLDLAEARNLQGLFIVEQSPGA